MAMYDHTGLEKRWRATWQRDSVYLTDESSEPTCYALVMFPYPSGDGLHVGHARVYIGADIYARLRRMQGVSVLHPMGWDAFGLPAEEYALKNGVHPRDSTAQNIAVFKEQCQRLGLSYDWEREISTTDPDFYKWTQWIFLQLFKRGLAYESHVPVNWCPSCKTGLANEDLEGGACERCGSAVERKPIRQWMLRITKYAEQLLTDLDSLTQWPEAVKEAQRNWIGRSEGWRIPFTIQGHSISVFSTRPDTLFGCSFIALSPENPLVDTLLSSITNVEEVNAYRQAAHAARPHEAERAISGVRLAGVSALHPLTKKELPVFVADYVLGGYGTGAVFGAPAHDERDFAFATQYALPIVQVIAGSDPLPLVVTDPTAPLIHSGAYDGTPSEQAKALLSQAAGGEQSISYRLQDWVFSRQRYWGEPIPLIHCEHCGVVPVPEEDLPVVLPEVASYQPTGTGESPLAAIDSWVNVACPNCGGAGRRETNTMPQWAGSSWYHLRFLDPHCSSAPASRERIGRWMPVDCYTGGMEHATRHLIYARFWHKVLVEEGVVACSEPYAALRTVGIVQAEGGGKMSKRTGNVINPLEVAGHIGADALRVYLAHIAPFSQTVAWDSRAVAGPRRFLERVYALRERVVARPPSSEIVQAHHQALCSIPKDIAQYRFNTAVSALMVFSKQLGELSEVPRESYIVLLQLLAPFAPFLTEELWDFLGEKGSVHLSRLPEGDPVLAQTASVQVAVQVLGKVRGTVEVPRGSSQEEVLEAIKAQNTHLFSRIQGLSLRTFIADRIVSFVA